MLKFYELLCSLTFFAFTSLPLIEACGPGNIITRPTASVLIRKMGPFVREIASVPDKPDLETVTRPEQLTCSSKDIGNGNCCWRQNRDSLIDWVAATGTADAGLMQLHFQQSPPTGAGFLVSYSNGGRPSSDSAILESCVIPCVKNPITVRVQSWQSDVTRLQVCTTPADTYEERNCQFLTKGSNSATVTPLAGPTQQIPVLAY